MRVCRDLYSSVRLPCTPTARSPDAWMSRARQKTIRNDVAMPIAMPRSSKSKSSTSMGKNFGVPYVMVRPGSVYGAGNAEVTGRVGLGTFGLFLHLGGSNTIPFTYVENCAEAIALAGLVKESMAKSSTSLTMTSPQAASSCVNTRRT